MGMYVFEIIGVAVVAYVVYLGVVSYINGGKDNE